jgi:type II secretory pathway pseudopilin PulG
MAPGSHRPALGFTLVAALLLLALLSLGLAVIGPLWSQQSQRERERDLLRVGTLYAQAIAAYQRVSPGSDKQYPATLDVLVLDTRFVGTVRHLRKLYADPMASGQAWGLVRNPAGRIIGVYSQSAAAPLAQGSVALDDRVLPPAQRYADWKFLALAIANP